MARRDDVLYYDDPPILPMPSIRPDDRDPQDMEELFAPPKEPLPRPAPMKVRTAAMDMPGRRDAPVERVSNDLDNAGAAENIPERAPGMEAKPGLVSPDDTRYGDHTHILVGDVLTGGMLPWIQATADVASGRVPKEEFDNVRQEHERRIQEMRDEHPDFVAATEQSVPFLTGLGMGALKPAATVAGTVARGAAAAAPLGAAKGYSSGPVEEPSASGKRTGQAVGGAAIDAGIGAAGASVPAAVGGVKSLIGKATTIMAESRKATADAAVAAAKGEKKAASTAKAAETRRQKGLDKQFVARTQEENTNISAQYARYNEVSKRPSQYFEENRKLFAKDPILAFNRAAEAGIGLEGFAASLKMPPKAILARLGGKSITPATDQEEKLLREMAGAQITINEFKKRGLDVTGPANGPAGRASATSAGGATAKPAAGDTTTSAGPKPARKSPAKPKPDSDPDRKSKPAAKPRSKPKSKPKPYYGPQ